MQQTHIDLQQISPEMKIIKQAIRTLSQHYLFIDVLHCIVNVR